MFGLYVVPYLLCVALSQAQDYQRTIIFVHYPTVVGQNIFIRGGKGISETQRPGCIDGDATQDPCAIPIRHLVEPSDTTCSYYMWSQGDNYLDWYGAEVGQGEYDSTPAGGTPLMWTTSDDTNSGSVEVDGWGYTSLNRFGDDFWFADLEVDCSQAEGGWFEFKTYTLPLYGWEPDIGQYDKCAGEPNNPTPYITNNHMAICGKMNVYYHTWEECNVFDVPADPDTQPPSICGVRRMFDADKISTENEKETDKEVPYIVNGNPATIGRWPWQGVLQYDNTIGGCAGVMIDENWALTAGHCVRGTNPAILKIRFGEQNLYIDQGNEQAKQVSQIIMHESYQDPTNPVEGDYDIALLQLVTPVDLDSYIVNKACLPYDFALDDFVGEDCWATGFGGTQGTSESYRLNEINVPVHSHDDCLNYWGATYISERQVCMGTATESACGGDSGGPLVCWMTDKWVVVGLTSWGSGECQNAPSVYTRVSEFLQWIEDNTGITPPLYAGHKY